MAKNSNNGPICSNHDKENNMSAANAPSNPNSTPETFVAFSPNPEQGSDGTTDSGIPFLPHQLFSQSNNSMSPYKSTPIDSTINADTATHEERLPAFLRYQVDESQ
jgi:hypothetical protein